MNIRDELDNGNFGERIESSKQVAQRLNGIFEHVLRPHISKRSNKHIEINIHLKTGRSLFERDEISTRWLRRVASLTVRQ